MTTTNALPLNVANDDAHVGVQAQTAYVDAITLSGDVRLTVEHGATPETKYEVGKNHLNSRNPIEARKLIWDAMMGSDHVNSEMLFHWLVAMLSGRTVREFSKDEMGQLKRYRHWCTGAGGDPWSDGARLIYRLLGSVLPSLATDAKPGTAKADMSRIEEEFRTLQEEQRDMLRPHLELFLTGPRKDAVWQQELELARSGQFAGGRLERAWMFFQQVPAEVLIPSPRPAWITNGDRLAMRASTAVFAAVTGYLGWELLWHGAVAGLLGYVIALTGGIVAAAASLELRSLDQRRRLKDEQFRAPDPAVSRLTGDKLADRVDALFKRYFKKYAPDDEERRRWESATTAQRLFDRNEIIEMCRASGVTANRVAWLIRYRVCQLNRCWQEGTLRTYRQAPRPRPGTVTAFRTGVAVSALGGIWAVVALRAYPLANVTGAVVVLISAACAWHCWLRVSLEHNRYAADLAERHQRQAEIDEVLARWRRRLDRRPTDYEMASWLECDRTILLGKALDHFHVPRSRLIAHAFLEEPAVAARRMRFDGGPLRYAKYQILVFLLADDGVRQVRATLDFTTGTLVVRERRSYRYDAIVAVRVKRERHGRHTFELRLTSGDPVTVRVRDAHAEEAPPDDDAAPPEGPDEKEDAEEHPGREDAEDTTPLDAASVASALHVLEGIAAEGRSWLREREWAGA